MIPRILRVRKWLEAILPEDTDELLQNLNDFRSRLRGDFSEKVRQLNSLTAGLLAKEETESPGKSQAVPKS
ncbi:MAG: hypothetical protein KDD01_25870 [Phaeodactylibacter sp.]|nr:hypothetical protein [Phaeodactylibacter sp.]